MLRSRRLELVLAPVLALAVGGLAVSQAFLGGTRAPTEEPLFGSPFDAPETASLACLSQVLQDPGALPEVPAGEGLDAVAGAVEEIRELRFDDVPEPTYLSPPQLSSRVREHSEDYTDRDAEEDERIYVALGALEPGTDLKALLRTALGEQVVGFYDPETEELVVGGSEASGLDLVQRVTLAHELEHALADQALGLPIESETVAEGDEDRQAAATALVEGDATLTMTLFGLSAAAAGSPDLAGLADAGGAGLTELPYHVQRSLLFPYEDGLAFVCHLHGRGGWAAVNDAYAHPPVSTDQILFPERYRPDAEPTDLPDPIDAGPGWTSMTGQSFGAADLLFLFEAPGGDASRALDDPRAAAAAWRAGEAHLWKAGARSAVAIVLGGSGRSLCRSIEEWHRAAFPDDDVRALAGGMEAMGDGRTAVIRCAEDEVRLGLAPDLATARRIAA